MKKPFKDTAFFKILSGPIVKTVLTKIPFGIGSMAGDLLNKNESPEGVMTREKFLHSIIKLGIYSVLIYLALSGKITMEDAEQAKDFITD